MPNRHPTPTPEYPIGSLRRSSRFLGGEKITNDDDGVVVLSKETISGVGAGSLDFLRNNPDPVLQELVKLYPGHLRVIEEHYSEFLQLINEPMDGLKDPKQEVQAQAVEAEPKAKDKDIPYVQDEEVEHTEKRHLNVVFMGHVDAGKSTSGGQILFLSGQVDDRTIQKYEKEAKHKSRESWYMAYIMDTNEEQRVKGKTVEVGRAYFETETTRFTILDAPGDKSYVPNMISGASQADIGVLVISARKGEFETGYERGGQTREHVQLSKTLGVTKLLMVVNKMDDPTVNWSKERYDEIESKMIPFLKQSGYNVKKDAGMNAL